jgi:hypothetical protein
VDDVDVRVETGSDSLFLTGYLVILFEFESVRLHILALDHD